MPGVNSFAPQKSNPNDQGSTDQPSRVMTNSAAGHHMGIGALQERLYFKPVLDCQIGEALEIGHIASHQHKPVGHSDARNLTVCE